MSLSGVKLKHGDKVKCIIEPYHDDAKYKKDKIYTVEYKQDGRFNDGFYLMGTDERLQDLKGHVTGNGMRFILYRSARERIVLNPKNTPND